MNITSHTLKIFAAVAVSIALTLLLVPPVSYGQTGNLRILVAGSELPLPARAEKRGAKIFLPLVSIAQSLGYQVALDLQSETARVRRGGVEAEFAKPSGEIRENGVTVISVPFAADVDFNAAPENFLLPLEIIAPLLNVSITIDKSGDRVSVTQRGGDLTALATRDSRVRVGSLDYAYNAVSYAGTFYQNFNLTSTGRIGSNLYSSNINLLGGTNARFLNFYSGNFTLQRKSGDEFQVGDLLNRTAVELTFMNALTRGAAYTRPLFGDRAHFSVFGGRASSGGGYGLFAPGALAIQRSNFAFPFDMTIAGARADFAPAKQSGGFLRLKNMYFSGGAVWYRGAANRGVMVDAAARYTSDKYSFQLEAAAGDFTNRSEFLRRRRAIDGFGTALSVSGSYNPWRFLTLQGRYDRYSPNFSGPSAGVQYNNREARSVSFSVRPLRRMSFGAAYTAAEDKNGYLRPSGQVDAYKTRTYGANIAYDPANRFLPSVSANATIIKNSVLGNYKFLSVNLTRDFERVRPFVNYILTDANGTSGQYINVGASILTDRFGNFQVQQGVAINRTLILRENLRCRLQIEICPPIVEPRRELGNYNGSVDWYPQKRLFNFLQLSVGAGYTKDRQRTEPQFRAAASTPLFLGQQLQFSYYRSSYGNEMRFAVTGPLTFWKKQKFSERQISDEDLLSEGKIRGRIYIDENGDRQFDPQIDTAIGGARINLDNGTQVVADAFGVYEIDRVQTGAHILALEFEDVRADLIPANGIEQKIDIRPRTVVDTAFRLVKSGSASGRVWRDADKNGRYDVGEGLPDIRLVSSSGQNTYTDPDGYFLISELPPGQQSIFIDTRYLPENLTTEQANLRVEIFSGKRTADLAFVLKDKPRAIKTMIFDEAPAFKPPTTPKN